jgi:hypothetical protein
LKKPERRQATDGKKKVRGAMDFFPCFVLSLSLSLSLSVTDEKKTAKKERKSIANYDFHSG